MRNLPEDKASFMQDLSHVFFGKHTGIGENTSPLIKTIKADLTRHMASTVEALQDEARYALNEFGSCENWTKVDLTKAIPRMVALLSGRAFVGKPLSRNEEWINATVDYTVDTVKAKDEVLQYPALIQNLAVSFLSQIRTVKQHKSKAAKLLRPIIEECMRKFKEEKTADKESSDGFDDNQGSFISWLLKWTDEKSREDPFALADTQLMCKVSFPFIFYTFLFRV